jgi:hypothetical protein
LAPSAKSNSRNLGVFACRPDLFFYTNVALDYSLVSVEGNPGSRYAIIQHPMGEPKQIDLVITRSSTWTTSSPST